MKILVDADASPLVVKEILYKTARRLGIQLILVANRNMTIPKLKEVKLLVVSAGPDEADNRIVEIMNRGDLVISSDIPLAEKVIKKGGLVLDPRGVFLTEENIGGKLAMRNLMENLRSSGVQSGGPGSYTMKDKQKFTNQLDKYLTKMLEKPC